MIIIKRTTTNVQYMGYVYTQKNFHSHAVIVNDLVMSIVKDFIVNLKVVNEVSWNVTLPIKTAYLFKELVHFGFLLLSLVC